MAVYRVGALSPPPETMSPDIWSALVDLLHYATEVNNVVRSEAHVVTRALGLSPSIFRAPPNDLLVAYQKIVHRGGYIDRLVLTIATTLRRIGEECGSASAQQSQDAAGQAEEFSGTSNTIKSLTITDFEETQTLVSNAGPRELVLSHRTAAGASSSA